MARAVALNRAELALRDDRLDSARSSLKRAAALLCHSDEANRLLRLAAMAERVEAEAAGRARALGEEYEAVLDDVIEGLATRATGRPRFDEACAWGGMTKAERERHHFLLGEAPPNPAKWLEVAAAFDAMAYPVPAIYARYRAAEAFVAAGDHAGAVEPLRAACATAPRRARSCCCADIAVGWRARIDVDTVDAVVEPEGEESPATAPRAARPVSSRSCCSSPRGAQPRNGEVLLVSEKTASVHVSRSCASSASPVASRPPRSRIAWGSPSPARV